MPVIFQRVENSIRQNYIAWKNKRDEWLKEAQKCEDFYHLDTDGTKTSFTAEQLEKLQSITGVPVTVNFIHPIIQQRTAILAQNKHSSRIISLDGRAKQYAQVLDKMKSGAFYHSHLNLHTEQAIKDSHISGLGCIMADESERFFPGQFGVGVKHLPYDFVILDPNMKDPSGADQEGVFIEKEITIERMHSMFDNILNQITDDDGKQLAVDATFVGGTWQEQDITSKQDVVTSFDRLSAKVRLRYYYDTVYSTMYLVPNKDGEVEQIFAENLDPEALPLLKSAVGEVPDFYVRKKIFIGNYMIWAEMKPITQIPIVYFWYDWAGTPYRSYGLIHYFIGNQEAHDKLLQLMIINGMLTNNAGWTSPKGGIAEEDKPKWEQLGAKSGTIKEYVPKITEAGVLKPERDQIQGIGNFYPTLLGMLQQAGQFSSGINDVVTGNANGANIEVFSSLQQYQSAAMQRIILSASHINEAMCQLGNIMVELLISTLKKSDYVFMDEKGDINEVKIADDINNFKLNKFLVVAIPSTQMPTQRLAFATELMKIAQSSQDPIQRQVYTNHALKLTETPEADQITEEMDTAKNLQQKVSQMEEALKRSDELTKNMENKLVTSEIENRVLKGQIGASVKLAHELGKSETELSMASELASGTIQTK